MGVLAIWLTWQYRAELFSSPAERYQSAYNEGNLDGAVALARAMLAEDPESALARKALAAALVERAALGQSADGEADVREALEIAAQLAREGDDPDVERLAGFALTLLGDNAGAIEHYRRAVALAPADANSHVSFGQALELTGKNAEASSAYERAAKLDSKNGAALVSLARIKLQEKDYQSVHSLTLRAFRDENQATAAEAHRIRALAYSEEGNQVSAIDEAEVAVALLHNSVPTLLTLGEVKYDAVFAGRPGDVPARATEILKIAEWALALAPGSAEANFLAYRAAVLGGKAAEAERYAAATRAALGTDRTISEQKKTYIRLFVDRATTAKVTVTKVSTSTEQAQ